MAQYTIHDLDRWSRFGWQTTRFDMTTHFKLTKAERASWEKAKADGYVISVRRGRYDLENLWWHYCHVTRSPYVVIREYKKFASLHIDMLPTDGSSDGVGVGGNRAGYISGGCNLSREVQEQLFELWRAHAKDMPRDATANLGGCVTFLRKIPIQFVEQVAADALALIRPVVAAQIKLAEASRPSDTE